MTVNDTTSERTESARPRPDSGWWPLVACCLGTFLLLLFTSIVTVPLPAIRGELGSSATEAQWVANAYTLALAGVLLGAGALVDAFGARRLYVLGLVGFLFATLGAGAAMATPWLIAFRAMQGACGATMFAAVPVLVSASYPDPRWRARAFATWGAVAGAASAVGTVGGGALTELLGWRWLFLAAIPICAAALILALRCTPSDTRRNGRGSRSVDWPGIVWAATAIVACVWAAAAASDHGWLSGEFLCGMAIAVGAGLGLWVSMRRAVNPVLPPALLSSSRFLTLLLVSFAYYFAAFGALPPLSTWLQTRLGLTPIQASVALLLQLLAFTLSSAFLSPRVLARSPGWSLGAPTLLIGIGAIAAIGLDQALPWPFLVPFLLLSGIGAGLVSPALPALAIDLASHAARGAASSASNTARQLGLALGVAVCGSLTRAGEASIGPAFLACALVAIAAGGAGMRVFRRSSPRDRALPARESPEATSRAGLQSGG